MTPEHFWEEDSDEDPPPLTDDGVALAERLLGVTLPAAYLDLLRVKNGGTTRGWEFPRPAEQAEAADDEDDLTEYVGELHGVPNLPADAAGLMTPEGLAADTGGVYGTVLVTPYMTREWELPPKQVLLAGDGHTWLSLDYRESADPRVVILQQDLDDYGTTVLAESFGVFLTKLVLSAHDY